MCPWKDSTHADALASLTTTLALSPTLGQKVFVASQSLFHPSQALEISKDAKRNQKKLRLFAKFQPTWNPGIDSFHSWTSFRVAFLLMTWKKLLPLKEWQINSFTRQLPKYCIVNYMTGYCSTSYLERKHKPHYNKPMMACVTHINSDLTSVIA